MNSTHLSVLDGAASGSPTAWARLVELYHPLVYGWLRRYELGHDDAEELTQDVMMVLVRELPSFSYSGRTGAFRHWLRRVAVHRAKGFLRANRIRATATGWGSFRAMVEQLHDASSELARRWDREHDQYVLRQLLRKVEADVEPTTFQAFRRQVFDGAAAVRVAAELGLSVGAVYSAKSRVLRKLRAEAAGLIDERLIS